LLYNAAYARQCSLSQSSNEIFESFGISISKQAYDERFDESAVAFVKSILEEQFSKQLDGTIDLEFLKNFSKVRIKDGTRIELPERLKDYFKGFGGKNASQAGLCIQFEYDLKNSEMLDLAITDSKSSDSKDAKAKVDDIEKGELVIRDLGYFSLEVIEKIIKKEAYVISRLNTSTLVYEQNGEVLSFESLYQRMSKNGISQIEKDVFIGQNSKIPIRLVINIVPDQTYQERMRKIEQYNRRKGFQTTNDYKARTRFNLFVTNIESKDVPSLEVYRLYKLRWQIELNFKIWKSVCGIDKLQPMKYHRFICNLYAKLLIIQINTQFINIVQRKIYQKCKKLLSKNKCFKSLQIYFERIRNILLHTPKKLKLLLQNIANMFSRNHWLEKRNKRLNYVDIFELYI
jgi:IS4 transposase